MPAQSSRLEYELWPELECWVVDYQIKSSRLEYELWPELQRLPGRLRHQSSRLEYELWPKALAGLALRTCQANASAKALLLTRKSVPLRKLLLF